MRKQIFAIATLIACTIPALSNAAVPADRVQVKKIVLSYDQEELATEKGRAKLERRIRKAASKVCGPTNRRLAVSLASLQANRECYAQAVARAMKSIDQTA